MSRKRQSKPPNFSEELERRKEAYQQLSDAEKREALEKSWEELKQNLQRGFS